MPDIQADNTATPYNDSAGRLGSRLVARPPYTSRHGPAKHLMPIERRLPWQSIPRQAVAACRLHSDFDRGGVATVPTQAGCGVVRVYILRVVL
ncbi:MAG: hypothetical protein ACR2QL_09885 [Woeseiaceae bacterium]